MPQYLPLLLCCYQPTHLYHCCCLMTLAVPSFPHRTTTTQSTKRLTSSHGGDGFVTCHCIGHQWWSVLRLIDHLQHSARQPLHAQVLCTQKVCCRRHNNILRLPASRMHAYARHAVCAPAATYLNASYSCSSCCFRSASPTHRLPLDSYPVTHCFQV